jgi:hypothetical protein
MSRKRSAGDTIEARCTRCRAVLNHTIVAMVEGRVVRVECNTCRGSHNYHEIKEPAVKSAKTPLDAKVPKEKKTPAPRAPRKDPLAAEREEWAALQLNRNGDGATPYDMNRRFRVGDIVAHTSFGLGLVKLVIPPNKAEILFETGKKLLRTATK